MLLPTLNNNSLSSKFYMVFKIILNFVIDLKGESSLQVQEY